MRGQGISGLAAGALAAGLLVVGPQAGARPRRDAVLRPRAAAVDGMSGRRPTESTILGARRAYAHERYRGVPGTVIGRARLPRFRRRHAPYGYYYYAPPTVYYSSPRVAYYYAPPTGYYYSLYHRRHWHRRYRSRIAGYRAYYHARTPPGWRHGRKRGWRGRSAPPGVYR